MTTAPPDEPRWLRGETLRRVAEQPHKEGTGTMAEYRFTLRHRAVSPQDWERWCEGSEPWLRSSGASEGSEIVYATAPTRAQALARLQHIIPAGTDILPA